MPSSNIKRKKKPGPANNAPNNGGGGGNFTETAMDEYLARLDLYRKPIAKDGSCLFRAVSEQVYNCQAKHLQVRKDCIDFMRRNRDKFEAFLEGPFDHHLFRLQNPKEWAGQVEISALSLMYKKDFVVYQDINVEPTKVTDNNFKDKIMLCYSNGNHYDAVYDVRFQKNAAICQSLVYEILYQKVFSELDRKYTSSKGPKQNPASDVNNVMTNYYQNGLTEDDAFKEDSEDNSGWTEVVRGRSNKAKSARQNRVYDQEEPKEEPVKPNLDQKHGWQAKRSLDNELYRNVELEVWEDSKNAQEQQDQSYAASIQYQPGDKCFAWLGQPDVADKVYEAIVRYNLPLQGKIEVKVPELGNKCFVIPLENLKPTENQQELNYRDLSGFYKKSEAGGGPPTNEGLRDDGKRGRRRNVQGRPPRGYKGDEHGEDTAARKGFQDESFQRQRSGPGPRDKFGRGRGRGRYPRGRDERQLQREDEEAKQIAEQAAKLAELQGKDPAAFPALPTQQAEEKLPSSEAAPDQSPAEFWSRLKNTQGKQPPVTPKENHMNAVENKPSSVPTSPTDQQSHTAKPEEKEQETKMDKPLTKEVKAPVTPNSEVESLEANDNHVSQETGKKEQNESQKQALFVEKEQLRGKVDLSKGGHVNEIKPSAPTISSSVEVKGMSSKSNVEEEKFADAVEPRGAWTKESPEKKELKTQDKTPENNAREVKPEVKKTDEPHSVKPQGVRGVIRMTNLNSKPQQSAESEEQEETQKEEIKLLRKEDSVTKEVPNLKSALAGEGTSTSSPEKKTVTFAEPVKEGNEIKVLVSTAKDLAGKDGKREVLAPPTLVSVVMKPPPALDNAQDNLPVTLMPSNKSDKNTSEDDVTHAKNSSPTPDANTKPQTTTLTPSESSQGSEGSEPAPSSSPSVSQHQTVCQLPFLPVMYTQLPNMTSLPRQPQGISVESDGSDLPEDPNTLRYFFNLGFQYHVHLNNQQWANQQMMYYPPMYQIPSQDHLHPAVSMGQQLSPAVPQMIYQQQMQAYHPPQIPQVMQDNSSFIERNSVDRSSPGLTQQQQQQTQQQQQQQPQQQQPIPLHQATPFVPNQHHATFRAARSMTGYHGKQMHMGGYNSQVPNQQTPRGPMQQGAGNSKPYHKNKKFQKHRNDPFLYGAQSQHAQNQGATGHGAHAYPNATQPAGSSSNAFYMTGSEHAAGKGSGDYYHGNQQFVNFHGNVSSSMTQAPHSAANARAQYP